MRPPLTAPGTWVYFFAGVDREALSNEQPVAAGFGDFYRILDIRPVIGQSRAQIKLEESMLRFESATALQSGPAAVFKGTVRHLQYTSAAVRSELQKKSAASFPAAESTLAVLIPIRKSAAWWALSQDERQRYFERKQGLRNHLVIGSDYAAKIYRKLYHSRYV